MFSSKRSLADSKKPSKQNIYSSNQSITDEVQSILNRKDEVLGVVKDMEV